MRAGSEEDVRLVRRIGDLELELQRDGVHARRRLAGAARAAMARAAAVIDMVLIASAAGGGGRLGKCESRPNTATLPGPQREVISTPLRREREQAQWRPLATARVISHATTTVTAVNCVWHLSAG